VREDILQGIRKLKCVHVAETVLNVGIDDELREPENLATQVERVAET
jgi:hypothetical protein